METVYGPLNKKPLSMFWVSFENKKSQISKYFSTT
jgi:RNAse (barnase) inhibitor barstar